MIGSGGDVDFIVDEFEQESEERDDEVYDDYHSYEGIQSTSRWREVHKKHDREDGSNEKSEETSVYGEKSVSIAREDFREQGSGEDIYEDMEEKCKYEKIRFHEIDVDIERGHKDEEKYRENRHLSENHRSLLIFFREEETIEHESHRDSDKNRKKSHKRKNIREDNGSLQGSEKNIGEKEGEQSSQKRRCDASETGEPDGDDIYFCRSEYIFIGDI